MYVLSNINAGFKKMQFRHCISKKRLTISKWDAGCLHKIFLTLGKLKKNIWLVSARHCTGSDNARPVSAAAVSPPLPLGVGVGVGSMHSVRF